MRLRDREHTLHPSVRETFVEVKQHCNVNCTEARAATSNERLLVKGESKTEGTFDHQRPDTRSGTSMYGTTDQN